MKRLFTLFVILLISVSSIFAQSSIDVNAQIRARHQMSNKDFNSDVDANSFSELRTRVGLKLSPMEDVSGFVQIQDSRIYGTEPNTLSNTANLDLHQAYVNVSKLFDLPLNLKIGRMELSYGPQRLMGAVGWSNVGRSFDGGVLQLTTQKIDVDFFSAKTNESGEPGDTNDFSLFGAYGNLKVAKNYKIQPFIIGEIISGTDFGRYTLGLYVNGKIGAFSHEIEAAYQLGSIDENTDISAYMLAANLKYQFKAKVKPSLGVGVDLLSGDDGTDDESNVFSTLYATNHKYYGFMDYFLNIPVHTMGLGLTDVHAKASFFPAHKLKAALAFHVFNSTEEYTLMDGNTSNSFGSELDLTIIYSYNKAVKFQGGFSLFSPGDIFKETRGEDSSTWAYLMAIVNL